MGAASACGEARTPGIASRLGRSDGFAGRRILRRGPVSRYASSAAESAAISALAAVTSSLLVPDLTTAARQAVRAGWRSPVRRGALRHLAGRGRGGRGRSLARAAEHCALRGGRQPADRARRGHDNDGVNRREPPVAGGNATRTGARRRPGNGSGPSRRSDHRSGSMTVRTLRFR